MNIYVEIGNEEQKKLITDEIQIIEAILQSLDEPPNILAVWVPEDFDFTVNKLQNTSHYTSIRGQLAIAKNVITENGTHLVFSPYLFTEHHDNNTRMQIYLHETVHALNAMIFPEVPKISRTLDVYGSNIYILYDEYNANRKSFDLCKKIFPNPSDRYKKFVRSGARGCLLDTINSDYYGKIQNEINSFRDHADVGKFLEKIRPNFDEVSKALVYLFAYIDEYKRFCRYERFLSKSKFFSDPAVALIDFFRFKYENQDVDLFDGIDLMKSFMEKFGMSFEDREGGLYCHVVDI